MPGGAGARRRKRGAPRGGGGDPEAGGGGGGGGGSGSGSPSPRLRCWTRPHPPRRSHPSERGQAVPEHTPPGPGEEVGGGAKLAAEGGGSRRRQRGKGVCGGRPEAPRSIRPATVAGGGDGDRSGSGSSGPAAPRKAGPGPTAAGRARFCPLRLFLFPSGAVGVAGFPVFPPRVRE